MSRIDNLVERINKKGPSKVFIQIPEGLKTRVQEIQKELEEAGIESIASLEPCYGACDLKDFQAKRLGCDLLVHIGHSKFCREEEVDTLYFPWYHEVNPTQILKENRQKLDKYEDIGLIASINFIKALEKAEKFLEDNGKNVFMFEGERTEKGQILGCDLTSALKVENKVDCFLYIGSGKFYALGLGLRSKKPIYVIDFEKENIYKPEFEKFKRQKLTVIEETRDAEKFGILLSTKKGQANPEKATSLKSKLEGVGREVWIFSMDEISSQKIQGIEVDCLVNTACPRVAIEHRTEFGIPILNPNEIAEIL